MKRWNACLFAALFATVYLTAGARADNRGAWYANDGHVRNIRYDDPSHDEHHHGGDHHDYDYFSPFDHRHETSCGSPIFEVLVTDHAFIERKVRIDYVETRGADGGGVDEREFEVEWFHALNNRVAVVVEAPYSFLDPSNATNTSGFGDMEAGFRFVAFDGENSIISFGLNVGIPTGDEDRDLGAGHSTLAPVFLAWNDLGGCTTLQTEVAFETPIDIDEPETEVIYNVALAHSLMGTACTPFFSYVTPLVEFNGITALNGVDSPNTVLNVTPGVRWAITDEDHAGVGVSLPIIGRRDFDSRFVFSVIHHY